MISGIQLQAHQDRGRNECDGIRRMDHARRGNTAAKVKSSGPTATLVANGTQRSRPSAPGSAFQKVAMRIGSTSDTVAIEASSMAPSRADGWKDRLKATMSAIPSVMICASRNASRPGRGGPLRHDRSTSGRETLLQKLGTCCPRERSFLFRFGHMQQR